MGIFQPSYLVLSWFKYFIFSLRSTLWGRAHILFGFEYLNQQRKTKCTCCWSSKVKNLKKTNTCQNSIWVEKVKNLKMSPKKTKLVLASSQPCFRSLSFLLCSHPVLAQNSTEKEPWNLGWERHVWVEVENLKLRKRDSSLLKMVDFELRTTWSRTKDSGRANHCHPCVRWTLVFFEPAASNLPS